MFTHSTDPAYFARSAREIEQEVREREKRLTLELAIENETERKQSRKNIFGLLATILFS